MIKNYFKTAFRSLWLNKYFSLINVIGLTLGFTVFLFIAQYVISEWSANRFNKNYDILFRVNIQNKEGIADYHLPPGFAPATKQEFPQITDFVRIADGIGGGVVTLNGSSSSQNKVFHEDNILYVDGNFLSVFSFPILSGAPSLLEPKTVAISEATSKKLFGKTLAIGKTITVSNQFGNTPYTVKTVYQLPETSDIKAEILLSMQTLESAANRNENDWADPNGKENGFTSIYLTLRKDVDDRSLASQITQYIRSINPASKSDVVYLQPLRNLHLAPSFSYPFETYGNLLLVAVFSGVGLLILIIAWLNYINLSTAQALKQAKNITVKKVLGASRLHLVLQQLTETLLLTAASIGSAMLIVLLLQPFFNSFSGRQLSLSTLNHQNFWLICSLLIGAGSFLAGGYIALVLTGFKPSGIIRNNGEFYVKGLSVRKILVVFQFTASIIFIIATAVLYRQLQFMRTQNLGMNLNQLLVIQGPTVTTDGQKAKNLSFKNSMAQLPFVKKIAASNNVPGVGYNFFADGITGMNASTPEKKQSYSMFICDQNFFDTYSINFRQGNTFSAADADASWNNVKKVIVNEKAAIALGFDPKENLIGKKINWGAAYEIVGVVKDYHHLSLREAVKPTIYLASASYSFFTVQTDLKSIQPKIATIKTLYDEAFPGNPFEYFFADEQFDKQYLAEQQLGEMFFVAAAVAIFIACLGLLGLAAFSAKQRVKEIGIRKVLGASVANIVALLSKDFVLLVIVSLLIASPVAFLIMQKWLQDFAYKTDIPIWLFVVVGLAAILITFITISFQAIKAALVNPVKSLRSE